MEMKSAKNYKVNEETHGKDETSFLTEKKERGCSEYDNSHYVNHVQFALYSSDLSLINNDNVVVEEGRLAGK